MFEQVKVILTNQYNEDMTKFETLKEQMIVLEDDLRDDDSEMVYQNALKELNKKYNVFKRGSKEYKEEMNKIRSEYYEKLKKFESDYSRYVELKNEAAKINIYVIQKKLEQLNNANSLEELHMTEAEATRIINGREM